jgi:hypothetical protein
VKDMTSCSHYSASSSTLLEQRVGRSKRGPLNIDSWCSFFDCAVSLTVHILCIAVEAVLADIVPDSRTLAISRKAELMTLVI